MYQKVKIKDLTPNNIIIENPNDKVDVKYPIKYKFSEYSSSEKFVFQTPKLIFKEMKKEAGSIFIYASLKRTEACKVFIEKILDVENLFQEKINTLGNVYNSTEIKEKPVIAPCIKFKIKQQYGKPRINIENKQGTLTTIYDLKEGNEIISNIRFSGLWFFKNWGYFLTLEEMLVL